MPKLTSILVTGGIIGAGAYYSYNNIFKPRDLSRNPYFETYDDSYKTLLTGDLVFIKYNLDRLNPLNRYKLKFARSIISNFGYDDLGIVYKDRKDNKIYILMLPSVNLFNNVDLDELNIKKSGYTGIKAIEFTNFVNENYPDLLSTRRLICNEDIRNNLTESIKLVVDDMKLSINSKLLSLKNQLLLKFNKELRLLIESLTLFNEYKYMSDNFLTSSKEVYDDVLPKLEYSLKNRIKIDDIEDKLKNLQHLESIINDCRLNVIKNDYIISGFRKKNVDLDKKLGQNLLSNESRFIFRVYDTCKILPIRKEIGMNMNISHYGQLDYMYDNIRLSSVYHIYTGSINKIRYNNLRYPHVSRLVEYKV